MKHIYRCTRPPRHWHAFLAAVGILAYLLTSCAGSRAPLDTPETPQAPRGVRIIPPQEGLPGRVDSLVSSTSTPNLFRRLFPKSTASASTMPRKFKGTINYYAPGSTVTTSTIGKKATAAVGDGATSTTTGKKSGPAVIASDSVDQAVAGSNTQQVTTRGNGNQVDAKKQDTTQEAPGPLAVLADNATSWIPYVAGGAALLLGFWLWRKKKQASNLIS